MPGPVAEVTALRDAIARTASDDSATPAEKARALGELRQDCMDLAGQAQSYLGSVELGREAAAGTRAFGIVQARANADVREAMLQRRDASAEDLDNAGYLSHEELDARERDGTLYDRLDEIAEARAAATGPHGGPREIEEADK